MKNKKVLIIVLIIIGFISIVFTVLKPFKDSKKFDNIGKDEIIQHLKNINDSEQKQKEIDEAINKGWITEKDVNEFSKQ